MFERTPWLRVTPLAITLIACYYGFQTGEGAEAVGFSTTNTVVTSCLVIIVLDYVLAQFLLAV